MFSTLLKCTSVLAIVGLTASVSARPAPPMEDGQYLELQLDYTHLEHAAPRKPIRSTISAKRLPTPTPTIDDTPDDCSDENDCWPEENDAPTRRR